MNEEARKKGVRALVEGKLEQYGATKRTMYSIIGILGCLLLTVVMSITGLGFDSSAFMTWDYWTGMIIQFGIAIFAMITGEQMGDDTQRNKPNSQFRRELDHYRKERERIDSLSIFDHFEAWLSWYRYRKLQKKIRDTIHEFAIKQDEVLNLDLTDVDKLAEPYEKDWTGTPYYDKYLNPRTGKSVTRFLSLSDDQREALKAVLSGAVKMPEVSSSYFMNALKGTSVDEWERASKADGKKGQKLASGYSYRMVSMLLVSLVINGLMPMPYESASAVALNIATRMFVLVSSAVWGIFLGFKIVEMDIVFLSYKTYILKLYCDEYESKKFSPYTVEEQADREYKAYEEKRLGEHGKEQDV